MLFIFINSCYPLAWPRSGFCCVCIVYHSASWKIRMPRETSRPPLMWAVPHTGCWRVVDRSTLGWKHVLSLDYKLIQYGNPAFNQFGDERRFAAEFPAISFRHWLVDWYMSTSHPLDMKSWWKPATMDLPNISSNTGEIRRYPEKWFDMNIGEASGKNIVFLHCTPCTSMFIHILATIFPSPKW